jgi:heat shock protein HslJ
MTKSNRLGAGAVTVTSAILSAVLVTGFGAGALEGCASCPTASACSKAGLKGEWVLQSIRGKDVQAILPAGARPPSIDIASDGSVSGFTGVNKISTSLDLDVVAKNQIRMTPPITTRMAGPPEAMDVESQFLRALEKATNFREEDQALVLTDGSNDLLRFVRGS